MSNAEKKITFARLVDWIDGRLSEHEARVVEEAVAGADAETLADVAWVRKFRAAAESVATESPSQETRESLIEEFEARTRDRWGPRLVERVLDGLTFDSNLQPAAGLRTWGAGRSRRQLIYHTDAFDLAVNLLSRGSDNDLDLDGQVLPLEGGEQDLFSVQLLHDGDEVALSTIDELGRFTVERIPPDSYELILSADRGELSIEPFDMGL